MMYSPSDGSVGSSIQIPPPLRVGATLGDGAAWWPVRGPAGSPAWAALAARGRLRAPWPLSPKGGAAEPYALDGVCVDTLAAPYRGAGLDGRGVVVAVIDLGFAGIDGLPASRQPRRRFAVPGLNLAEGGLPEVDHGTAVVETIAAIAPGVTVWTAPVSDEAELLEAMAALMMVQPDLIVASIGFDNRWPADGTSPVSRAVGELTEASGAVWVAAAGNEHGRYRWGALTDADGDGRVEIGGRDGVEINVRDGFAEARLRWTEPMGAAAVDLSLELEALDGTPCARADDRQDGAGDPVESAAGACGGIAARVVIRHAGPGALPALEGALYAPGGLLLGEETEGRELTLPADARGAIAVGACAFAQGPDSGDPGGWLVRGYSSRGPTEDGRPAPALCAPDGFALQSVEGGFFGTSAAAPVVGGLLALAIDARRRAPPDEALSPLDVGAPGADTGSGAGLAQLSPPPCACAGVGRGASGTVGIGVMGAILVGRLHRRRRPLA